MRLLISNIPEGADMGYIIDGIKRIASDEVDIRQIPEIGETE